jgi:hypothetical protein
MPLWLGCTGRRWRETSNYVCVWFFERVDRVIRVIRVVHARRTQQAGGRAVRTRPARSIRRPQTRARARPTHTHTTHNPTLAPRTLLGLLGLLGLHHAHHAAQADSATGPDVFVRPKPASEAAAPADAALRTADEHASARCAPTEPSTANRACPQSAAAITPLSERERGSCILFYFFPICFLCVLRVL